MINHLTKPIRAIHFMALAFLMTLSTQVNAQVRKEFVCNKWSQMGDVVNITTRIVKASKPFVLVSDGNTLLFKNLINNKVVASKLVSHTPEIDLYSSVSDTGRTTSVFYYFHKGWNFDKEPWELIEDPDVVGLREVGHSIGDLLNDIELFLSADLKDGYPSPVPFFRLSKKRLNAFSRSRKAEYRQSFGVAVIHFNSSSSGMPS